MKHAALCLVLFDLLLPCLAWSHDLWIEPAAVRPVAGDDVEVALRVGEKIRGDSLPRIPTLIDRFFIKGRGAESPVEGVPGRDPAGSARVTEAGLHWIAYQSHPYPLTLEARKFEDYLREEGLERIVEARAREGQSAAPGRERFCRCAKALLEAGGEQRAAPSGVFDIPLGLTLELVPRRSPYALRPGEDLPLSLLFRGRALASVLVVAMNKDNPEKAVSARTDGKGLVTLRLAHAGFWLIKAVHMEAAPADAGVDWESWWASVTFEIGAPGK